MGKVRVFTVDDSGPLPLGERAYVKKKSAKISCMKMVLALKLFCEGNSFIFMRVYTITSRNQLFFVAVLGTPS